MSSRLPSLGHRGEGWLVIQVVLLLTIGLAGTLGPAWQGPARVASTILGALLLAGGGVLAVRGVIDLGANLTPLPHPREAATLVDHGAYSLVRHPIYSGLIGGSFGWGLVTASPAALALAFVLVIFFDLKCRREEAWLMDRFPGYEDYRVRTKRLIPFVY